MTTATTTQVTIHSKMAADTNRWLEAQGDPRAGEPYEREAWSGELEVSDGLSDEDVLEHVFRVFNRVDVEDVRRLDDLGYHLPSLSVNDEVELDGRRYRVEALGFAAIEKEER